MNNSLLKGLAILQILARSKAPLGVTAVARQLGISKGNVHRMLQALVQTGFVVRHDRGQYGVSIKLWELGSAALTSFDLRQHAADIMDHLVEETGHSAHLSVLDLTEVVYVHKVEGLQSVRAYSQIGGRAPAYCVATGNALLAEQGEQTLRSIAARLVPMTPNTITNPDDFFQEIREIRRCGYAVNRGELRVDVSGVAVGVCDARGHTLAAIGISGPSEAFSAVRISEYARRVSEAGTALSERFGGGKHAVLVRSMSAWARQ